MNIGKETKAYWGDKFIEILDPHKPGHIVRVYPDYWDEKAPSSWVELTKKEYDDIYESNKDNIYRAMMVVATYLKRKNNIGVND